MIDNSSAFRMDPDVPLVIPEINARRIAEHKGIIAVPNCSAITALVPLWPIHRQNRIKRLIISTYQAASGAGAAAMDELVEATRANLAGEAFAQKVMPHPYAFNIFNHDTPIDPATGYNGEETKVIKETRKIFEDDRDRHRRDLRSRAGAARAFPGHHLRMRTADHRTRRAGDPVERAGREGRRRPGRRTIFPMPIDASGQDDVLVGRIRKPICSDPTGHSISMFVAADQLLKGAALNAIQIAELLPQRAMA